MNDSIKCLETTLPADWKPNSPNFIATEQVIWKNNVMTGIIHRNVAETQVITNLKGFTK